MRSGEDVELDGKGADLAFATGKHVRVTAAAENIFAAGRTLRVEGAGADHFFLAGREIDLAPAAARDVIAAGGRIRLHSGVVSHDVVAAGGDIRLDRNSWIRGSTVLMGRRLRIEAPVGRALVATGGRVELDGPVAGEARIRADEIVIGPGARIGGDLHLRGERIEISPSAVVQGRTVRETIRRDENAAPAIGFGVLGALFGLGALLAVGVIVAGAPQLMEGAAARLRSRAGVTIGVGALIVLLGPPVILALLASVLGAPLALFLGLAYLLAIPLAFTGVSYWIGQVLRGRTARARSAETPGLWARIGWTVLAALLLMIVCAIPIIGGLIWLLTFVTGVGAVASYVVRRQPGAADPTPGGAETGGLPKPG